MATMVKPHLSSHNYEYLRAQTRGQVGMSAFIEKQCITNIVPILEIHKQSSYKSTTACDE